MKVTTVPSLPEIYKSPKKKSRQQDRCVTDKFGFAVSIILFMFSFGSPTFLGLLTSELNLQIITTRTSTAVNESSINGMSSNSSKEAVYDTFLSGIKAATNDIPLIHSFICNAVSRLLAAVLPTGIFLILLKHYMIRFVDIYLSFINNYSYHFIIVSAGKIILTLIFLIVTYFQCIDAPLPQYKCIAYLVVSELMLLGINVVLFYITEAYKLNRQYERFKSTLRYYIGHRYLILLQFLNLMTTSLFITYAGINLYVFFSIYFPLAQIGICFIVCLSHNYVKMVIILAKASHNWEKNGETISIKTVLLSMITIMRFHLGTTVFHVPIARLLFGGNYTYIDVLRQNVNTQNRVYMNSHVTRTMKHLMMFSAIYGQATSKAAKSLRYFEKKNRIVTDFKNTTSVVFADVLTVPLPSVVLNIFIELSTSTSEELFALIPILTSYVVLTGTYFYVVINTMNTVENTIEFCNMIKKEDIEEMYDEEQSKITEGSTRTIVTITADKVDEKQDNESTVNGKKI